VVPRVCLDGKEYISLPPGFDPRTVQSVTNLYTEYAIPDYVVIGKWEINVTSKSRLVFRVNVH
jgi:hypothetical protein